VSLCSGLEQKGIIDEFRTRQVGRAIIGLLGLQRFRTRTC
jgi:hypothetical protein